jgi:hypothetical protein
LFADDRIVGAAKRISYVSTIDLTPTPGFYDSSGKALALYTEVVNKIDHQELPRRECHRDHRPAMDPALLEQIARKTA